MDFLWGLFNSIFYNKSSIDTLTSNIYIYIYIYIFTLNTEIDTLYSNMHLNSYYTKAEIDDLDNAFSTLILNTYNKK